MSQETEPNFFRELINYAKQREAPNYLVLAGTLAIIACLFYELALYEASIGAEITNPVCVFAILARLFLALAISLFWYQSVVDRNTET